MMKKKSSIILLISSVVILAIIVIGIRMLAVTTVGGNVLDACDSTSG